VNLFDTCVVTAAGGAKCWGRNTYGALGNGSTVDSRNPVDVVGLTSGVASVAVGVNDTCALTTAGSVKCWGFLIDPHNILGPLTHTTPIPIVGLPKGVTAISVHGDTCALVGGGDLKCGGDNTYGELGDGTTKARAGFVDVIGLTKGVTAFATGVVSACAITGSGALKCWGDNGQGQLGDGLENNDAALPVDVVGLASGVMAVAVGDDHACALMSAGNVKCWGGGGAGQLGNGARADSTSPVEVLLSNP
jgi:alpha-tubulin suppressor-like RCC1 family protein